MQKLLERFHLFKGTFSETNEKELLRANARGERDPLDEEERYVPLLLEHPWTGLQYRTFSKADGLSSLLIDAYEMVNQGVKDIWYPVLPTPCICLYVKFNAMTAISSLCGATTTMGKIRIEPGYSLFCIRFRVGVADFFTSSLGETNLRLDTALPTVAVMCREIQKSESFRERVLRISRYIKMDYCAANYEPHEALNQSLKIIHRRNGVLRVAEVSKELGCSERYLCKLFQNMVGVSTKQYCEIVKLQSSLRDILTNRPRALANTAGMYGYFDQPHMNRVYQKYLGRTASDMRFFDLESCNANSIAAIL